MDLSIFHSIKYFSINGTKNKVGILIWFGVEIIFLFNFWYLGYVFGLFELEWHFGNS